MIGLILCVAAICGVGFWLVLQRVCVLDERLKRLADDDRSGRWAEAHQNQLTRMSSELEEVRTSVRQLTANASEPPLRSSDLNAIGGRVDHVLAALDALSAKVAALPAASSGSDAAADAHPLQLRQALENEGFNQIFIAQPVPVPDSSDAHRLAVEARRNGVSYKGHAQLEHGRLTQLNLRPAYDLFP